jgi:DNA-binding NtrC family response regulator
VMSLESFKENLGDGSDSDAQSADGSDGRQDAREAKISFPDSLPSLRETEQALIDEALRRAQGNQSVAARTLGLSRRALNNRLRRSDPGDLAR